MSRKNDVGDPMPIRLQTSHRLMSLPSLILDPIADDDDIDWNSDPFEMRPDRVNPETPVEIIAMIKVTGTAEEPLSRIDQHLLYIGPVPARTGRPNGYRNRSTEVGAAAQPPLPSTPFR